MRTAHPLWLLLGLNLSPDEVADITAHIRQLQVEAGLIEDSAG